MKKILVITAIILASCSAKTDYDAPEFLEKCPKSAYGENGPHDWQSTLVLDDLSCTYKCSNCGREKILDDSDIATYSSVKTGKYSIKYDYVRNELIE